MSKPAPITFAARLRSIRELSGLSQAELAGKADIHPTAIAHMEAGSREPGLKNLTSLVKALGVSADVLLGTARP